MVRWSVVVGAAAAGEASAASASSAVIVARNPIPTHDCYLFFTRREDPTKAERPPAETGGRLPLGRGDAEAGLLRTGVRGLQGLLVVATLADLLDDLRAESGQVVGLTTCHETGVDHDL